jgi:hypothetical protein
VPPVRRAALAVALACLVVAVPVAAVEEPRDAPEDTAPPVVVFAGEEDLDVSEVELTGGGRIGTDEAQLVGVSGDADGVPLRLSDPTAADFDDVETGAYDSTADADERPEVTVTRPDVTELVLRSERGVNVTGDTVDDLETLTVEAEYDFDEADRLDVTVENPDGLDLTPDGRITESPGSLTVDVGGEGAGTVRVTVEGSELEDATRTATVTVGDEATRTRTRTQTRTRTASPTPTPTATATEFPPTPTPTSTPAPTESPTPTASPTPNPSDTPEPTPTSTTAPGDGVGVVVAVAALVLAALAALVRRR